MSADRNCIARFTLAGGTRFAAGNDFSLARSRSGVLYSWGSDIAEALGNGAGAAGRSAPGATTTAATFDAIATAPGARHSLAVERTTGRVLSWGDNTSGQLGDGSTSTRADPVVMRDATGAEVASAIAVAAGESHSLVLLTNGDVLATGSNSNGQLGDGTTNPRQAAAKVDSVCGPGIAATAIAAGSNFSLALCANGSVRAWGANSQGQLGDASFTDRANPVSASGLAGVTVTAIAAGGEFALALDAQGGGWSWGSNARGQLGTESRVVARRNTAARIGGFDGGIAIAAGLEHAMVVLANNVVFAWGANDSGQVDPSAGSASQFDFSFRVAGLPAIVAIAAGKTHSMAMDNAGAVWTWGGNTSGQLGLGSTTSPNQPSQIAGFNLN